MSWGKVVLLLIISWFIKHLPLGHDLNFCIQQCVKLGLLRTIISPQGQRSTWATRSEAENQAGNLKNKCLKGQCSWLRREACLTELEGKCRGAEGWPRLIHTHRLQHPCPRSMTQHEQITPHPQLFLEMNSAPSLSRTNGF